MLSILLVLVFEKRDPFSTSTVLHATKLTLVLLYLLLLLRRKRLHLTNWTEKKEEEKALLSFPPFFLAPKPPPPAHCSVNSQSEFMGPLYFYFVHFHTTVHLPSVTQV